MKTVRNWLWQQLLMLLIFISAFTPGEMSAQVLPTIDGNPVDWNAANFNLFSIKKYQGDAFGNGVVDNQFTEGSKDFFPANQLVWSISQTKAKNDIANAAAIIKDGILYFAGDRTSNNGDAQIGFWLYLNGTGPVTVGGNNTFSPPHVDGDVLVLADFTGGGRNATVTIYQWDDDGVAPAGQTIVPNTNNNLRTTTGVLTGTVAENNDGQFPIPSGWTFLKSTYEQNMFFEGRVDLTALGVLNLCNTSFLLETRSSQSITASLDDFVGGGFSVTPPSLVLSGSAICSNNPNTGTITSTTSQLNASYQLYNGSNQPVGPAKPGTGAGLTWNNLPAGNGYYVVGGGGIANCTSTSNLVNVTNIPPPTVTANDASVCVGSKVQLSASPAGGTWSGAHVSASGEFDAASLTAGTYNVTYSYTDPQTGCSNTDQATVTVYKVILTANGTNPNCFGQNGSITFSSTGGKGTVSFTVNGQAATSPYSAVSSGKYTIVATDELGCTDTKEVTITIPSKVELTANGTDPKCYGETGSITFNATGGTGSITYTVNGTASTSPVTGLAAGSYTIVATDANGCTDTKQVTIAAAPTKVVLTANGTDPKCYGETGSITFSATGGTGSITYTVNGTASTSPVTGLAAGSYTIVATDANGCTDTKQVTIAAAPSKVELTANGTDPKCYGETGSITFSATGGTGSITYTVNGTASTSPVTGLAAGSYTIVATDANGCTDTKQVTIAAAPSKVELTANGTDPKCYGETGSITFSATGGTGSITYTVNGTASTSPVTGLAAGSYTIVATDANGCTDTKQVTIAAAPSKVELTANGTDPKCYGETGSITFSATGGTGSITYTVNGTASTSPVTGLAAGSYTIVATDANGCTDTKQVTIAAAPSKVELTANGTDPKCYGETGSITFSATGGTGSITYTVNGTASTSPVTGLAAGSYTIVATDANGCTDTKQVTIAAAPTKVVLTANGTDPKCYGETGSITFSATGGTGSITYTVNGTASTSPVTGLAAGSYTIVATDANGCTDTKQVTIAAAPTKVVLTANGTDPKCYGETGSITFSATGGTGSITYTVNGTASTSPVTGLAAGSYTIVATDANGCTDTKQVTIAAAPSKVELTANGTDPKCYGETGSITFNATGGTGSITYTVNGTASTSPVTGLAAGSYTIVATDANGCTDTKQVTIAAAPSKVELTANGTDPKCYGETGSITFSATGGTGSITYTVNGTASTSPVTGLAAGSYTIVATDANGCTDTKQVTIAAAPSKVELTANGTDPKCYGETGSITFSATGGTGSITYTVNGTASTSPVTGLAAGSYTIVATDANGCTDTKQVTIAAAPSKVELTANGTDPKCYGETGSITFSATGGTGSITYTVNGTASTSPVTGLAAGSYTIVATDANGCTDTKQVTIAAAPSKVELTANGTDPKCYGETGSITFSATGGTGSITYTVNGTASTSPVTGLAAGSYTIVATDANGCTDTKQVTITIPDQVIVTADDASVCIGSSKQLSASPAGGTWSGANVNASGLFNATGLTAGSYQVTYTYTNANGCINSDKATVTVNPLPVVVCSVSSSTIDITSATHNAQLDVDLSGNADSDPSNYTYSWSEDGAGTFNFSNIKNPVYTASILDAGQTVTFTVTVTNKSTGCVSTSTCSVNVNTTGSCPEVQTSDVCNGSTNTYTAGGAPGTNETWKWSVNNGASIVGADNGQSVTVTAGIQNFTLTLTVSYANTDLSPTECKYEVTVTPCIGYCTYTQGKYGNTSPACDGDGVDGNGPALTYPTVLDMIKAMLGVGGTANPLVIGSNGNTVTIPATSTAAALLNQSMPGGSSARELLTGNCVADNVPSLSSCWTPGTNTAKTYITKQGKINNVLLSQTITLGLNMRVSSGLSSFVLQAGTFATAAGVGGCGSSLAKQRSCSYNALGQLVVVNEYMYKTISQSIIAALNSKGYALTAGGLYKLANDALGNADGIKGKEGGASLSDINQAVSSINEGFDECRIFIGWNVPACSVPSTKINISSTGNVTTQGITAEVITKLTVSAYPNPFVDKVNFVIASPVSGKASLEVYSIYGQKLQTVFEGYLTAGKSQVVEFRPGVVAAGTLVYRFIINGKQITGKVISTK